MIATRDWWQKADPIEAAIVDALRWNGPLTSAELARVFDEAVDAVGLVHRLKRLLSEGVIEVADARLMHGVVVRRYRAAIEG